MEIMNYVESMYAHLERCEAEGRGVGYIKDIIAGVLRGAIIEALQEQKETDPETPNMRLECLKIAAYTAPKKIGDDRPSLGAVVSAAATYMGYVQTGDVETIGDVSQETSKGE